MAWVSPTGHNDLDTWTAEGSAYDDNTATHTSTTISGGELELTIGAIACDKIQIYASDYNVVAGHANPDVTISVYYDGSYHQIYSGSIVKQAWNHISIGSTEIVTKVKISGTLESGHSLRLYELDFNSLPLPTVETDACSGVAPTSFDANGDIIASEETTTRGFHYSKVYDGFEWGSDEDPLSDDGGSIDWTISVAGTSKAEIDTDQHYSGTRSARLHRDGTNTPYAEFSQSPVTNSQPISMMVKKDDTADFLFYHSDASSTIFIRFQTNEEVRYRDPSAWIATGASVTAATWHHLLIKNVDWVAKTYDIYLDGLCIKSAAPMYTGALVPSKVRFDNTGGTSNIYLDEVGVWDVEDEDGTFSAGEYDLEISGLDSIATYYVQAFAKNAAGIGYGVVVSITTSYIPTHVEAIGTVIVPTLILGSTTASPTPIEAVCVVLPPQLFFSSCDLSPPLVEAVGSVVAPTVIRGSLVFSGMVVSAICDVLEPSVKLHSTEMTPNPAEAVGTVEIGDCIGGATMYTPDPAEAIAAVVAPTADGSQTLQVLPPEAIAQIIDPATSQDPPQIHVQSNFGTIVLNGTLTYAEVTLDTPVMKGKSFVIATARSNDTDTKYALAMAYLTDLQGNEYHKVRVERGAGWFGRECYVDYQVITGEGFTVQEGETEFSNGAEYQNAYLETVVDLTKAFIVTSSKSNYNGLHFSLVKTSFHDTSTLICRVALAYTFAYATVRWQVVEWDGATVQSGEGTIAAGNVLSTVDTLAAVDESHAFVIHNYKTIVSNNIDDGICWAKITNSTSVEFRRGGSTYTIDYEYFVVEHPELTVEKGDIQLTSAQTVNSDTLGTPVELDTAFIPSYSIGNGYCDCSATNYLHRGFHTLELEDTETVTIRRGVSGDNLYSHYQVCSLVSTAPSILPVEAACEVVVPTVVRGSLTLTPSSVEAVTEVVAPTVSLATIWVAPGDVEAIGSVVAPTVVRGSIVLTPDQGESIATVEPPTLVLSSTSKTPDHVEAVGTVSGPIVLTTEGSIVIAPESVVAIGTSEGPDTILGSTSVTPEHAEAIGTVVWPWVTQASIWITPAIIEAIGAAEGPTVSYGDFSITPSSIEAIAAVSGPVVVLGSTTATPTFVAAIAAVSGPSVLTSWYGRKLKVVMITTQKRKVNVVTTQKRKVRISTSQKRKVRMITGG